MSVDSLLDRCEAIAAAGSAATSEDVEWLLACFSHPLKVVQRRAGEAVITLGDSGVSVGPALEAAMEAGPLRARWVAAWAACRLGIRAPTTVDVLIETLGLDDGDLRWASARLVTERVPRDVAIPRLARLAEEGNAEQRKMALYCLRDLEQDSAEIIGRYRSALGDATPGVRMAGMAALVRHAAGDVTIASEVAALLDDRDGGVRRAAAASLGRLGVADARVLAPLRRAAADRDAALARAAGAALATLSR